MEQGDKPEEKYLLGANIFSPTAPGKLVLPLERVRGSTDGAKVMVLCTLIPSLSIAESLGQYKIGLDQA